MEPETIGTERRSFLGWAIFGLGAVLSAILGIPIACYVLDPRNRKGPNSSFKLVDLVRLDDLPAPRQGVIRDVRTDGWTLYPNDVLGRVWVVPKSARPAGLTTREAVEEFNRDETRKASYLTVFTTTCPHLGCFVNLDPEGTGFACPCHAATFTLAGAQAVPATNPARRGMDTLEWEIDADDPEFNKIKAKYVRFKTLEAKKIPLGSEE